MSSHVVGRLDVLGIDSLFRLALDIFDFKGWIKWPEGTILIEVLGEVVDFHKGLL
jgi:hypothetical protein